VSQEARWSRAEVLAITGRLADLAVLVERTERG
jgi:hypothetical protein